MTTHQPNGPREEVRSAERAQHAEPFGLRGCAHSAGIARDGEEQDAAMFARSILTVATDIERAETELKQEIITAARAGDCARVQHIALCWRDMAALDALNAVRSAKPCES